MTRHVVFGTGQIGRLVAEQLGHRGDNLYAYGPTGGQDLVESLRARPTSAKAATRAAMAVVLWRARADQGVLRPARV